MRASSRKHLVGIVVSTKNTKTISVRVDTYKKHKLYSKRYLSSKKFAVHDEKEIAKLGDRVEIAETRPLSATKHFRLVKILQTNEEGQ